MATIKSCSDLRQSKKLAKILPLETADMYWDLLSKDKYAKVNNIGCCLGRTCVYAWSLAALINVLPKGTNISTPDPLNKIRYSCWNDYDIAYASNPVDACVAMIEKLHELNLL